MTLMAKALLHDFIIAHREEIIERARQRVSKRTAARAGDTKLHHGIPIFLTQLVSALAQAGSANSLRLVGAAQSTKTITDSATLNGRDLLTNGLSVGQVVNGYGDVCQVVTELAGEVHAAISVQDFQLFNGCLDDAIAGAVTAYSGKRERDVAYEGTERLGVLAHELRNLMNTATLAFGIIKEGKVGLEGSTASMLARSLSGLSALVDRSLAQVRLEAGLPKLERVAVADFIGEVEVDATIQLAAYGLSLSVDPVAADIAVDMDRQLLSSAVLNLLQNAFKFTRTGGRVKLTTRATADRVQIEVADECGGLPPGKVEELFQPFARRSADSSGLGLGLTIAMSAVRANSGDLHVRDIPGTGCVFTVDLPRQPAPGHRGEAEGRAPEGERRA
jgi:signal transduction histidine kinase